MTHVAAWIVAIVWLFFGVVAVTMIPADPKLSPLASFARFLLHLIIIAWLGPFAFAAALDALYEASALSKALENGTCKYCHSSLVQARKYPPQ
jgi:hypothetical protein